MAVVNGSSGDDNLSGTKRNDLILGNAGNDTIDAGKGNDKVFGGSGDDTIDAGKGNDKVFGGSGDDTIDGGRGHDIVFGGYGDDEIDGGSGNDILFGGSGSDTIDGGRGHDIIFGGSGNDTIDGEQGNDLIFGGSGDDDIDGGQGHDVIFGGAGDDTISGDGGRDWIYGGTGDDEIFGGASGDKIWGNSGDDTISGDGGDDWIGGGSGNDTLFGGEGHDDISGGSGNDEIEGGAGRDWIWGSWGEDRIDGGADDDKVWAGSDDDTVFGGSGDDWLGGDSGNDEITGGSGNDDIDAGTGDDTAVYVVSDNIGASDFYNGNKGTDKLRLVLTQAEANDPAIQADIAAFQTFLATNSDPSTNSGALFHFSAFNLTVRNFEGLELDIVGGGNQPPVLAAPANIDIDEDTTEGLAGISVSDVDSASLTVTLSVSNGTLAVSSTTGLSGDFDGSDGVLTLIGSETDLNAALSGLSYTPATNSDVDDQLQISVDDGQAAPVGGTVDLTVNAVADAPRLDLDGSVAGDQTTAAVNGDEDTAIALEVFAALTDLDGSEVLSLEISAIPVGATLSDGVNMFTATAGSTSVDVSSWTLVSLTITPPQNSDADFVLNVLATATETGPASLVSASTAGSINVTVASVNDAPTTTPVVLAAIAEDSGVRVITQAELLANANDIDGPGLTAQNLMIQSGSGTLVDNLDGTWDYTPTLNDDTSVTFSYEVTDGIAAPVPTTASLDITPVNDAPTTTPVVLAAIAEDSGVRVVTQAELLANANDVDGPGLTAQNLMIQSGSGMLVDNLDGTWDYTPALNDDTSVTFSYEVTDGVAPPVATTASLDITPVNDAPTLSTVNDLSGTEDVARQITFADLILAGDEADIDGTVDGFRVEAISSGTLTLVGGGAVTPGVTIINVSTAVEWTPVLNANGVQPAFTVVAVDDGGLTSSPAVQVSVDLAAVNNPPTLTAITDLTGTEDVPRQITFADLILAGDEADIDGTVDGFRIEAISSGTLTLVGGGAVTPGVTVINASTAVEWTPVLDTNGVQPAFTVVAVDNGGLVSSPAVQVNVDLAAVDDAPTTTAVTLAPIAEDSGVRVITQAELLANANDVDTPVLTAQNLMIQSGSGMLTDNLDGTWDYTPALNDDTSVTFSYEVTDGTTPVATTADLDITPVNDAPTTTPVTLAAIAEDSGVRVITQAELLANANDVDGPGLTAQNLMIQSGNGMLTDNLDGTWDYTPALNDDTSVTFSYEVTDGIAPPVATTASLDITPVNDAPTTTPVTLAAIAEDSGVRVITQAELLANANDVDGPGLTAQNLMIQSGNGALVDNLDGTWDYTPALNDDTSVTFSYEVTDGVAPPVATTASLDITPVNDAPTLSVVNNLSGTEDVARQITFADLILAGDEADIDGTVDGFRVEAISSGTLTLVGGGAVTPGVTIINASTAVEWTPVLNANGVQSAFTVVAVDDGGLVSSPAVQVSVNLAAVNNPPTLTAITDLSGTEDVPRQITFADLTLAGDEVDIDGTVDGFRIEAISSGTLTLVGGGAVVPGVTIINASTAAEWTPVLDTNGVQPAFTVVAVDNGGLASSPAVQVNVDLAAVDDAPTTSPVTLASIVEDSGVRVITQAELLANANDVDTPVLSAQNLMIQSGNGALVDNLDGTWDYTPALNDDTSVTFSYEVTDGTTPVATTADLDITPVNDAPTTSPVVLAAIAEDSGVRVITQAELLANANDVDGPGLTAQNLMIQSGSGSLVDNLDGTWDYTPALNDDTSVTFSYEVTDGIAPPVATTASLDITPVNDAPTTTPVVLAAIAEDSGVHVITQAELLANANDIDGPGLTAQNLMIQSGSGTLVDNLDGTWDYTPALNDDTSVTFSYEVTDGIAPPVATTASLDITPVNDAPTTTPVVLAAIAEDSGVRVITQAELLANANDVDGPGLTAQNLMIQSGSGTLVDNLDGTWDYTPALNDDTSVTFSYEVTDGIAAPVPTTASLDITPVNDAPMTSPVVLAAIAEDSGVRTITQAELLANAGDVDGPGLTAQNLMIQSGSGTLVDNLDGTWDYTPALNDDTDVTFSYEVTDGVAPPVATTASLEITPVNDAPTLSTVNDLSGTEDVARQITIGDLILAGDEADIDGTVDGFRVEAISSGTLTLVGGGAVTPGVTIINASTAVEWTPVLNANGVQSAFTVVAVDDGGLVSSPAVQVSVNLAAVNNPPTLTVISDLSGTEDVPRQITFADLTLAGDEADIDGTVDGFRIEAISSGTLTLVGGGAVTPGVTVINASTAVEWTPVLDTNGVQPAFTVVAVDNGGLVSSPAVQVNVDLAAVDDAPTTTPVTLVAIAEDSGVRLITQAELLANATDVDTASLTAINLAIQTGNGLLVDNLDGTWDYTPALNDDTSVTFSYEVTDGTTPVATTADLDITPVNDAPTTTPVTLAAIAEDSGVRVITQAELLANANDVDGPGLTAQNLMILSGSGSLIDNLDGTWDYTPSLNDDTSVTFSYEVTDGIAAPVPTTASLDIMPVNDAPTTSPVVLAAIAEDSGVRTITQAELLANANDIDGPGLTAQNLMIQSGSGMLVDNLDGTWDYTPALNDDTSVTFSYEVTDGIAAPVPTTASLDITPVNDAPTTSPAVLAAIAEDSGVRVITQAELLANANDVDGPGLTAQNLTIQSGSGTLIDNLDGTWDYTPALNDDTSVTFSYEVTDGIAPPVATTASLDITPVNDAPTTSPVVLAAISEDSGVRVIIQAELLANANDIDGPGLTAQNLMIQSGSGMLVDNLDGTWDYTPALNDDTSVTFSYEVTDGIAPPVPTTASLNITPVNDAPTTTPVTLAAIAEDSGVRVITQAELLANANDVDGPGLTAQNLMIQSGSGTLVDNLDGTWDYTPSLNDDTSVTFSYEVTDGIAAPVPTAASLDITSVNDAPTTSPVVLAAIAEDSGVRVITQAELLANANDVDGPGLTAQNLMIQSGSGTLVDNLDGTWDYTPSLNDDTSVTFSYEVTDGIASPVATTASLDITPVNDAPTTSPVVLAAIAEDSGVRVITQAELLANANDIDGPGLTAQNLMIQSGSGSLIDNLNGTWDYTPSLNDDTSVTFSYEVTDGIAPPVPTTASLDITPINDAPTTSPVVLAAIAEDSGVRVIIQAELLANANDVDGPGLTAQNLMIQSGSGTLVDNLDGTWDYTPALNDDTSVTFSYEVTDGIASPVATTASLDITPVNDTPTTSPVVLAAIAEDSGVRVITQAELLANANDVDGPGLTAQNLMIQSGSGTLVDNLDGTWDYTPALNDDTSVTFSYEVTDGIAPAVATTASLDITPVNDAPTTSPVVLAAIAEDSGVRVIAQAELLFNANDVDGPGLTAQNLMIQSGLGTLVDNLDGTWDYTPALNDDTAVTFSYEVTDGIAPPVATTASLDITPVNDAPTTSPVTLAAIAENSGVRVITQAELLANATDVDTPVLTAQNLMIQSGLGSLVDNLDGTWDYTPAAGDDTSVTFSYEVSDGIAPPVATTADLDITPVNDAPSVDLDADDSSAPGADFAASFIQNGGAIAIVDADVGITDADSTNLASATITLTNAQDGASESLTLSGSLPVGMMVAGAGSHTITFSGNLSLADYETALGLIRYNNTATTPETATVRTVDVTVNDGTAISNTATTTITVGPDVFTLSALDGLNGYTLNGIDPRGSTAIADESGRKVAYAGDVNGDGFSDVLIGAQGGDPNGNSSGEAYLVFGGPTSLPALDGNSDGVIELSSLGGTHGFVFNGVAVGDLAGSDLFSAGDVNGDGIDDLIIAASQVGPAVGASYLIFGGLDNLQSLDGVTPDGSIELSGLAGGAGTNGYIFAGLTANALLGFSVATAGDLNGDGFDDLIVGAAGTANVGRTYVVFGGEANLQALDTFGGAAMDGVISIETAGILDGSNGFAFNGFGTFDSLGAEVSPLGDVNGDGLDDLMIASPQTDLPGLVDAGQTYLVFGQTDYTASSVDGIFNLVDMDGTIGYAFNGTQVSGKIGAQRGGDFNAGDVNGDGFDDIVFGTFYGSPNGAASGQTYLIFGGATNLADLDDADAAPGDGDISLANLDGVNGFRINGEGPQATTGFTAAGAGDINGDGFDDIIIGGLVTFPGGATIAGQSYVLFGGLDSLQALDDPISANRDGTIELSDVDGTNGFRINGIGAIDRAGSVSSAGDVNGDGFDDLIIGAYFASPNGNAAAGQSYIIFGAPFSTEFAPVTTTGTAAAEIFIGGAADDVLTGGGGADVMRGGAGDDLLTVSDTTFERIDGGGDQDTLAIDGSGVTLDLTGLSNSLITGVETIDITGTGNNTLTLSVEDVFNLSDTPNSALAASGFAGTLSHNSLVVMANLGDTVNLQAPAAGEPSAGGSWVNAGQATIDSQTYDVFNYLLGGDVLASVAVDEDI